MGVVELKTIEGVIQEFLNQVRRLVKVDAVYIFGSWAKGQAREYSDIDVAVVSGDFSGVGFYDAARLTPAVLKSDASIEVHPFRPEDFDQEKDPLVAEILFTGIKIL
jgi:uncharacterized protein